MKYLCKKAYNDDFVVGKYYSKDDNWLDNGFIVINGYWFYDFPEIKNSNINDYFDSTKEIRKKKLKKLNEIKQ